MKKDITHIFFDLDHTLWDFDTNSALAFDEIFKRDYPTIDTKLFLEHYIPINQACWALFQVDKMTHEALRYQRLKQSFDAINYAISDDQIEQIAQDYIQLLPEFNHLFEDALETLSYLKARYQLHIITNGFAEVQFRKMSNSNLSHYFKTVTNSEMAGAKKPNPIIFQHALHLAQAQKNESIMIGDSIEADVNGALDFGMEAIFFNPNQIEVPENIIQISTLAQLKTIF
ncbi:YjjG family noncanonical pyrimidine nucleotidase [Flavobacterium sp.]|uniref:YjjG family noncanonical pyrimidine nucleotidase n=1 Tax=Flavobacterium sp. TaxID=239 RepID=UPI00286C4FF6|nr:YjjG family noncanonical pyrimidine nucleotidase [Flavobacterium sp.]